MNLTMRQASLCPGDQAKNAPGVVTVAIASGVVIEPEIIAMNWLFWGKIRSRQNYPWSLHWCGTAGAEPATSLEVEA